MYVYIYISAFILVGYLRYCVLVRGVM